MLNRARSSVRTVKPTCFNTSFRTRKIIASFRPSPTRITTTLPSAHFRPLSAFPRGKRHQYHFHRGSFGLRCHRLAGPIGRTIRRDRLANSDVGHGGWQLDPEREHR